jgi:ubiquinone/menaquinone biosynthesis C-methylase UbiE
VESKDRIPAGWDITLSDLSSGMLDSAWRNLVVTGRSYQFKEIDAQSIPFADETFDGVTANFMLYHVPDRPKAFAEIKRVLKPGGRFIAATIGNDHMKEMIEKLETVDAKQEEFQNPFTLESGLDQVKPFFPNVTLTRYEDALRVTEIEPIEAYIRSSMRAAEISQEGLAEVLAELEKEIKEQGSFFITKAVGLFEAVKIIYS